MPLSYTDAQRLGHVQPVAYGVDNGMRAAALTEHSRPGRNTVSQTFVALEDLRRCKRERTDAQVLDHHLVHRLSADHIDNEHQEHGAKLCNDLQLGIEGDEVKGGI